MQAVIDLFIISLFVLMAIRGWRRGFAGSVCRLGRLILSLTVALLWGPALAGVVNERLVNPPVYEAVLHKLSALADGISSTADGGITALAERLPKAFHDYLDLTALDPTAEISALVETWSRAVSNGISRGISVILGHLLLFGASYAVFTLGLLLARRLAKLPVIRAADRLLGLGTGLLGGLAVASLAAVLLTAVLGLVGRGEVAEGALTLRLLAGGRALIFG